MLSLDNAQTCENYEICATETLNKYISDSCFLTYCYPSIHTRINNFFGQRKFLSLLVTNSCQGKSQSSTTLDKISNFS